MKIILKEDISNLGYKDDVVEVKDGYGRNYLIPTGKAVIANAAALKVLAENQRQRAHKIAQLKAEAEEMAAKLKDVKLTLSARPQRPALSSVLSAQPRLPKLSRLRASPLTARSSRSSSRSRKSVTTLPMSSSTRKFSLKFLSRLSANNPDFYGISISGDVATAAASPRVFSTYVGTAIGVCEEKFVICGLKPNRSHYHGTVFQKRCPPGHRCRS